MKILRVAILALIFIQPTTAQNKDSLINELIKIADIEEVFKSELSEEIIQQRKASPEIEIAFWLEFKRRLQSENYTLFNSLVHSIYDKYFEVEDLKEIIEFYKSSSGQKLLKHQSAILLESQEAGELLGNQVANSVLKDLENIKRSHFEINLKGCEDYRKGFFINSYGNEVIEIERTSELNIERHGDEEMSLEIEWLNDCKYVLKNVPIQDSISSDIIVNIYEHLDNGYLFSAVIKASDFYAEGEIYFKK